jgi:hypothetical protein
LVLQNAWICSALPGDVDGEDDPAGVCGKAGRLPTQQRQFDIVDRARLRLTLISKKRERPAAIPGL